MYLSKGISFEILLGFVLFLWAKLLDPLSQKILQAQCDNRPKDGNNFEKLPEASFCIEDQVFKSAA